MFIPRAKDPPRPDYPVVGPFILMRGTYNQMPLYMSGLDFDQAIEEFVRYCCPPADVHYGCGVLDRDGVKVIGWRLGGGGYDWFGVEVALVALRQHEIVPPLMLVDVEKGVLK